VTNVRRAFDVDAIANFEIGERQRCVSVPDDGRRSNDHRPASDHEGMRRRVDRRDHAFELTALVIMVKIMRGAV